MGIRFRETFYTPLAPAAAEQLVRDFLEMAAATSREPEDIVGSIALFLETLPAPETDDETIRARLSSYRTAITLEYQAGVADRPRFVTLHRKLLSAVGPVVVATHDAVLLAERLAEQLQAQRGSYDPAPG